MIDINPTPSIIIYQLYQYTIYQLKKRLSEWIKSQDPIVFCTQEIHFRYKEYVD